MTTTIAPAVAPRRVLLLTKAQGDYKHSGKYFLHNGRWHKLHADKPAPKGAPVSAHPHAAGQHVPKKHLTDAEWEQLKLPAENVNSGTFNKQIDKLKELAEGGHVSGILGMQYGTNTYGKKLAIIANHVLGLYRSEHKVTPGQKAGEHAAVSQAPVSTPTVKEPAPAPAAEPATQELGAQYKQADGSYKISTYRGISASKNPNDHGAIGKGPYSTPFKHIAEQYAGKGGKVEEQTVELKNPLIVTYGDLTELQKQHVGSMVTGFDAEQSEKWNQWMHAHGYDGAMAFDPEISATQPQEVVKLAPLKAAAPAPAEKPAAPGLAMPDFAEGKTKTGVKAYYDKVGQKVLELAAAGDVAGLEAMKADGLKPNKKGKVSNTWAGKTANSKMLLELHAQALEQVGGAPVAQAETKPEPKADKPAPVPKPAPAPAAQAQAAGSKVSQIPWDTQLLPDSNTNSKSHNGKVAQIKAMAEAGDLAGLEAFKAGKNTYGQKQMKLAALAIAALKEDAAVPVPAAAPAPTEPATPAAGPSIADKIGQAGSASEAKQAAVTHVINKKQTPEAYAEAISGLKQHGYDAMASLLQEAHDEAHGPKEGDTKQGADGMLVFKNGRWHKQEQPQAAEQHPIDAVPMPELTFSSASSNAKVQAALDKLKEQIKAEGPSALKGVTKHMKSKGKYIVTLPGQFGSLKVYGYEHAPDHAGTKVHAYVEALKEAAGKPKKAPKAAPPPAAPAPAAASGIEAMDSWKQIGPQAGSNAGGKFVDDHGVEWYCKFPANEDVAKSEVLAARLYAAAGVTGQDAKLVTKDGKIGIASKWTTVSKATPAELAKTPGVLEGFATDAWLGNWDVVGLGYDNLQVGADGKAVRVDAGGSLTYRAQGGKKAFGTSVIELDSLRDAKINPQAAAVFGKMTEADITASVTKVAALSEDAIRSIVEKHGPGDEANRKALADVLVARRADLLAKHPKAAKPTKKRLDPNNLPVDPDRLPKAHDFSNWLGAGKPLSSQPHVNAANMAVEQELLAMAKTGNLTKLKDFKFHAIDKATGNATGELVPIAQHPSKHVQQLHADLVMILEEIANPPEPLKVFHETDVGTVDALASALPSKKFGTTVNAVKSNEKLGFWVVLGTAHGVEKFRPKKVMDYTADAIQAGYAKFKQASKLAKHFMLSVQASGSYNDLFRAGKTHDPSGNKLSDVAQAALEHATTMPEGTSVYRWQSMSDEMVQKVLAAPEGTVFQATGPMCTSYHPTATAGFAKHRVTIRYAKGAKAVESFGSTKFPGEKEITTLPNSRFVILKRGMVPDLEHGNPNGKRLELEVLMLPPDLGL